MKAVRGEFDVFAPQLAQAESTFLRRPSPATCQTALLGYKLPHQTPAYSDLLDTLRRRFTK
jgi:hypothetical protein